MQVLSGRSRRQWAYTLLGRVYEYWCAIRFLRRPRPRVAIVIAGWTQHATDATCGLIDDWVRSQRIDVSARILATSAPKLAAPPGYELVRTDNSGIDIGTMADGLQVAALAGLPTPDYYLIGNDRISHYEIDRPVLPFVTAAALRSRRDIPAVVGKLYKSRRAFVIGGISTLWWIQTHLLLIQGGLAERLEIATILERAKDLDLHFTTKGALVSSPNLIDRPFREFLERALVIDANFGPSEWRWHGARHIEDSDLAHISAKARTITVERYLAAAVLNSGGILADRASFNAFNLMTERLPFLNGQVWRLKGIRRALFSCLSTWVDR